MNSEQMKAFEARLVTIEAQNKALETENNEAKIKLASYEKAGMEALVGNRTSGSSINSDEQKCLRMFGVGSVKKLLETNVCADRYSRVPQELKHMAIELKKDFQNARFIAQLFHDGKMDKIGATEALDKFPACPSILETSYAKDILIPKLKAFGTGVTGGGAEWIPTMISSSYIPEFELERELVGTLQEITMPSSPYELPFTKNSTTARKGTEGTTATESSFGTDVLQFNAKKFLEYYILPEEVNEDSIVSILELARQQLSEAHKRAFETATINGVQMPLVGVHIDSDTNAGAADLAEKQWTGLRKLALDNSANGGTTDFLNAVISDAKLGEMRASMGKFAVSPMQLLWVMGPLSYLQMIKTTNVVTVDKMGPNATILTGQLGAYDGIPIIQSGYIRQDMNATGVYDGVTVDRTGCILIRRDRLYFATRRPIRLALRESRSADDRYEIASYSRTDFVARTQDANEVSISYGLNVAT